MFLFTLRKFLVRVSDYCYALGMNLCMLPMLLHDWLFPENEDPAKGIIVANWSWIIGFFLMLPFSSPLFIFAYVLDVVAVLKPVRKYLCG